MGVIPLGGLARVLDGRVDKHRGLFVVMVKRLTDQPGRKPSGRCLTVRGNGAVVRLVPLRVVRGAIDTRAPQAQTI
jgi:hypothetical protein